MGHDWRRDQVRPAARDQQRRDDRAYGGPQFVLHVHETTHGPLRWHRDDYTVVDLVLQMGAVMDSAELRAVQQPLKDAYRENPEKAVVTLRAHGQLDDAISCSVETGRALATAGLHPASGGDGSLLCSGDMLLQALVACAGVTLRGRGHLVAGQPGRRNRHGRG